MNTLRRLWTDEVGSVMTAEMVMLGTVAVLATSAGVSVLSTAVSDEVAEMALAVRAFDQSVVVNGYSMTQGSGGAQAASTQGSAYVQTPSNVAQQHVSQSYHAARAAVAGQSVLVFNQLNQAVVTQANQNASAQPSQTSAILSPQPAIPQPAD